ncbi:MAG: LLM class flavin-dependent oxidoreductase [Candidatus Latescibacterota bacterium]|nr:LLM class flavin-dependent oxidoreductase [Candidatus Latescibacterota bacterium]
MNLGMFMMPLHPPKKDRTRCFDEDVEAVLIADRLGFAEAWIGQHHTVAWEPIPSNDLFIAHLLPKTRRIRLGTGVSIVPHHHPVNIAVRLAFLDHLSRGRINCGFGQSGVPTDLELFDLPDPKTQGLMTVAGIDLILRLWEVEAPFDLSNEFWNVKITDPVPEHGIGELLKPYQKPHPPIGMSAIKGTSLAARMAGERGYMPMSTNLVPTSTVAEHWVTYSEGAEAGGREQDRGLWRVSRSVYVGESQAEAEDHCASGTMRESFAYLVHVLGSLGQLPLMKRDPEMPDEAVTPDYCLEELCIIGDAASVTEQLAALKEETGGFDTLLMIAHDWDDKERWVASMEKLAEEVIPKL